MMKKTIRFSLFLCFTLMVQGLTCESDRKKECEWYLMPDIDRVGQADEGLIPVCARNFKSNKQDCRLQTTEKFAREHFNKPFRYTDLKVKNLGIPRTIDTITFCSQ